MLKAHLVKYAIYNHWANERLLHCCSQLDNPLLDQEIKSSFPSIRKTVFHIWDAECIWHKRLLGEFLRQWPSKSFKGELPEAIKSLLATDQDLIEFLKGKDEEFFTSSLTYHNLEGKEFKTPICDILLHVFNHSTYHRGQLVTMLREVGYTDLKSTDFITFVRI